MDIEGALDTIQHCQKQIDYWQAQQVRALGEYAELTWQDEFASSEIAAMMHWTRNWTEDRLGVSRDLVTRLPATVDALEKGDIDLYKAQIIHTQILPLSAGHAAEVEQRVLTKAPEQTSVQMRQRGRRIVMSVDPDGTRERVAEKKAARAAGIRSLEDDMAMLWITMPADKAMVSWLRVDKLAEEAKFPGDTRTLNQRRADVIADLLLATPDNASPVQVQLMVTVSATTLMGLDEHPGELEGYGPISADLARELAGDATWRRLLTDPASGVPLDLGTSTYRPPAHLRRFLWARDKTCRMIGCTARASRCEVDHTIPFPAGPTADHNNGMFCTHDHRLKHESGWTITQPTPGTFKCVSPTGRVYIREPEPVLPGFH
ncbi:DUF222 domain-containing protein [Lentzea tibetensis]|uniref:DUF222 domain-containing protein n=1 Tax=Lentzea tibetensis TaxID=2591470 RepID=A0A563EL96_9PSEU|nr:HNH endonuclease signature motif containing protein [Lentzea tibetensis]TWP47047.1 DUF222 domain-containing protein [Lentzea tibetensis]